MQYHGSTEANTFSFSHILMHKISIEFPMLVRTGKVIAVKMTKSLSVLGAQPMDHRWDCTYIGGFLAK